MVLRTGTKLFLTHPGAQRADSRNKDVMGKKCSPFRKNRQVAPVPKTLTDRTDKHQLPPAAAGKDRRRGVLAGIHVFINKLKLMSLFTGSKTMQDSKAGESQACGREGRGADPHGLSSSRMGSW